MITRECSLRGENPGGPAGVSTWVVIGGIAVVGTAVFYGVIVLVSAAAGRGANTPPLIGANASEKANTPVASPSAIPSASVPFRVSTWTHQDLANHLRNNGVSVRVSGTQSWDGSPAAFFYSTPEPEPTVIVTLHKSDDDARKQAGAYPNAFAWKSWSFRGDTNYLNEIRNALNR